MKKSSEKRRKEHGEELGIRAYFLRVFEKYDIRDEQRFIRLGRGLLFIVLLFVEALILLQHVGGWKAGKSFWTLLPIIIIEVLLTLSEALRLFVVTKGRARLVFYIVNALTACGFLFVTNGTYSLIVYALVLTEMYISVDKRYLSITVLIISVLLYGLSYAFQIYARLGGQVQLFDLLTQAFESTFILVFHFLVVQVALAFYRQFLRLDRALKELAESKKELEKAYEVVAEVSALEERQRIAKEIHDTAGHSITTVIMQTEAAKLIIDTSPDEAKPKIVAANLQAKHALEELRESVHLLSGTAAQHTLKMALEGIIHESTDGTGITIRSQIEDVVVSEAKFRFLCNTLKEGISNGLRHGGATAFWFELKREAGKLCFLLSDNGVGVGGKPLRLGFGLTSMQERAKALGGEIVIISEADEGFELHLTLPI